MKATAVIERDEDGAWIAELVEEPRCQPFGRTLAKAKQHIIEAASLWFEVDESKIDLEYRVAVGDDYADRAVAKALNARHEEHAAHERSVAATRDAVPCSRHGFEMSAGPSSQIDGYVRTRGRDDIP